MSQPSHPQTVSLEAWEKLPAHPRLLAGEDDWRRLRTQVGSDPVSKQLFEAVLLRAGRMAQAAPIVYEKDGKRLLGPVRFGQARILSLAMAARLTDEAVYLQAAQREMLAFAALPDWNPSHFLDVAEATLALALGYDWLYDRLEEPARATIREAILEKGLRSSLEHDYWVARPNNWNQVCHAGIVAGALAIAPDEPELGVGLIRRALENVPIIEKEYAPDGAYVEGPTYWGYGTAFHLFLIEFLTRNFGSAFGLDRLSGFMESADFMIQTQGPTGNCFNYSDATAEKRFQAAMFWFARERDEVALVAPEIAYLPELPAIIEQGDDASTCRIFPLALLWWKPREINAAHPYPLHWSARGMNPIATHRSAWGDPRAAYIAFKGGKAASSHGHMDVGSFILECDGVRWAEDITSEDYGALEAKGIFLWNYKIDSARWTVFWIGPDAHNILRFDGALHQPEGFAEIVDSRSTENGSHTIADLTALYPGRVSRARRGVKLAKDRTIWIQDEWTAGDAPASAPAPVEASFQWITHARVEVREAALTLHRKGETLSLRVVEPAGAEIAVEEIRKDCGDEANPGLNRIVIRTRTPANTPGRFALRVTPGSAGAAEVSAIPLDLWG